MPTATKSTKQLTSVQRRAKVLKEQVIEFVEDERFTQKSPDLPTLPKSLDELTGKKKSGASKAFINSAVSASLYLLCETQLLSPEEEQALFCQMNYAKFKAAAIQKKIRLSNPKVADLDKLEELLAESQTVRDHIICANVRLVVSIAKSFANAKNDFDELISDGILTLMRSVEKFDFSRGFRFSTYATHAIRRQLYKQMMKVQQESERMAAEPPETIADSTEERDDAILAEKRWMRQQQALTTLIDGLDEREQIIVRERFGLAKSEKKVTLQKLADRLNVCKERVRQLEKRAVEKLRDRAEQANLVADILG